MALAAVVAVAMAVVFAVGTCILSRKRRRSSKLVHPQKSKPAHIASSKSVQGDDLAQKIGCHDDEVFERMPTHNAGQAATGTARRALSPRVASDRESGQAATSTACRAFAPAGGPSVDMQKVARILAKHVSRDPVNDTSSSSPMPQQTSDSSGLHASNSSSMSWPSPTAGSSSAEVQRSGTMEPRMVRVSAIEELPSASEIETYKSIYVPDSGTNSSPTSSGALSE
eukprot:gnl/TRDRNA2_/TRDRNA2_175155_c1_seq5.p1 gnl/TRDRNA2_/TRDRNA2_175155_c1~~gnl/TRDRNA2_/TRDRNA2_175155_c1_seq5.p1  ORF type:complete len:250 (+),score=18.16 gnl/TRDRNA2_/TRDRNA2_175155_c1_seq5:73-750(+)